MQHQFRIARRAIASCRREAPNRARCRPRRRARRSPRLQLRPIRSSWRAFQKELPRIGPGQPELCDKIMFDRARRARINRRRSVATTSRSGVADRRFAFADFGDDRLSRRRGRLDRRRLRRCVARGRGWRRLAHRRTPARWFVLRGRLATLAQPPHLPARLAAAPRWAAHRDR